MLVGRADSSTPPIQARLRLTIVTRISKQNAVVEYCHSTIDLQCLPSLIQLVAASHRPAMFATLRCAQDEGNLQAIEQSDQLPIPGQGPQHNACLECRQKKVRDALPMLTSFNARPDQ